MQRWQAAPIRYAEAGKTPGWAPQKVEGPGCFTTDLSTINSSDISLDQVSHCSFWRSWVRVGPHGTVRFKP